MPNFNLLLTVTSGINGFLIPVFVAYIRFITVNKPRNLYFSVQIANTSGFRAKQNCESGSKPTT
jgi:hypothetical protein